jgi:hypothetical protein
VTKPPPSHTLNTDITLVELLQALKKLQRNKAVVLDGMKIEFILDAKKLLHMPLLKTFNCFLEELSNSEASPLLKSAQTTLVERAITVGPILTKLFTMILDKRLSEWAK